MAAAVPSKSPATEDASEKMDAAITSASTSSPSPPVESGPEARSRRPRPRLPRHRPTLSLAAAAESELLRLRRELRRAQGETLVLLDFFFLPLSFWFALGS